LGIRVMLATKNKLGSIPFSSLFWKSLCVVGIFFSKCWKDSPVKSCGPGLFFMECFKLKIQFFGNGYMTIQAIYFFLSQLW